MTSDKEESLCEEDKNLETVSKEHDVYRDSALRYLGYANEVGEAFRPFVHVNAVRATYGIASCYVIADANNKGQRSKVMFEGQLNNEKMVLLSIVDTLLWQGLASVIIPGFTINRLCWSSRKIMSMRLPLSVSKGLSTVIGLAAIPFIIKPIDAGVDELMERTFRAHVGKSDITNCERKD